MPTFKLWLLANHPPYIAPDDGACWRRLVRLPFIHTIPVEKRDPFGKAADCWTRPGHWTWHSELDS